MYIHGLTGKRFACRAQDIVPRGFYTLSSASAGAIAQCIPCWWPGRDLGSGLVPLITVSDLAISSNRGDQSKKKVWRQRLQPNWVVGRAGAQLLPAGCPGGLAAALPGL